MAGRQTRPSVPASSTTGSDQPHPPDLARLADHVAAGRVPFPADLSERETGLLAALVRQALRDRLVRHVARAIAADLLDPTPAEEPPC